LVLQNDKIVDVKRNLCLNARTDCALLGLKIVNNVPSYECVKCPNGFDHIVSFADNEELILTSNDVPVKVQNNLTYRVIKSTCEVNNQTQRRPSIAENPMFNNCQYWYKFPLFAEKGCSKCQHGYYGEVINWGIKNC
jgi:hypothetical protein